MRVVFLSNFYNHHQKCFSETMNLLCDGEFAFIETESIDKERIQLGWGENTQPSFVHSYHKDDTEKKLCNNLIKKADVIIAGSASEKYLWYSHFSKKVIFRYSERVFKEKKIRIDYLVKLFLLETIKSLSVSDTYMLCASAYAATDFSKMGKYRKRTYKWGYFPEAKRYDISRLISNKDRREILWCGRFLDWKHPDMAIKVAKKLVDSGYEFKLKMIGNGPLESELKQMIVDYGLTMYVDMCGSMKPDEVRKCMEHAGIFLFTSDRYEGWGAVLNESMNSACAVIATADAGSTPYLIENGKNGIVYQNVDNIDELYVAVQMLLRNEELQTIMGKNAYHTIINEWNAENAAKKLYGLAEQIRSGKKYPFICEKGICSKA